MADTIDLLQSIGSNAALRHASAGELAPTLARNGASNALMAAVICGDSSLLSTELGHKPMKVNHDIHTGGHGEGDEPGHDHGEDDPGQPPEPDQGEPLPDR